MGKYKMFCVQTPGYDTRFCSSARAAWYRLYHQVRINRHSLPADYALAYGNILMDVNVSLYLGDRLMSLEHMRMA